MGDAIEQGDHLLEFAGRQILRDEDNSRALILIGPFGKPGQVVQQMLRALDDCRLARFFPDVHQSFHPQQVGAKVLFERSQQQVEGLTRERLVPDEVERRDAAIVPMGRMRFVATFRVARCTS